MSEHQLQSIRIAVLEDNAAESELYRHWIEHAGHSCHLFAGAAALTRAVTRESFDLFMLDWNVPDRPGIDVLRTLRETHKVGSPILFATGRDSEDDIVEALSAGADDYMIKPVRRAEVVARIAALIRRSQGTNSRSRIEAGPYSIDVAHREVKFEGAVVTLTDKEFELAVFFFRHLGVLVSRAHIQEVVWGYRNDVNSRAIDTHVSNMRKKMVLGQASGYRLTSVYSFGYRLEAVQAHDT
jgi:DNA-binding response OmpR family regulator